MSLDAPCLSFVADEAENEDDDEDENENEDDGRLLFRHTKSCVAGDGAKAWLPLWIANAVHMAPITDAFRRGFDILCSYVAW